MMARDPVGAKATNCMALDHREDVYNEVLQAVLKAVEQDARKGVTEALAWQGKVSRATVKRAVDGTFSRR